MIKELYLKYGKKGLEIVLKSPPENYSELLNIPSYMDKIK